jgi:hypothetical protein
VPGIFLILRKVAKLTKKALGSMGAKIMRKAKEIRKKSPSKKWTSCVKEAGKQLKK